MCFLCFVFEGQPKTAGEHMYSAYPSAVLLTSSSADAPGVHVISCWKSRCWQHSLPHMGMKKQIEFGGVKRCKVNKLGYGSGSSKQWAKDHHHCAAQCAFFCTSPDSIMVHSCNHVCKDFKLDHIVINMGKVYLVRKHFWELTDFLKTNDEWRITTTFGFLENQSTWLQHVTTSDKQPPGCW